MKNRKKRGDLGQQSHLDTTQQSLSNTESNTEQQVQSEEKRINPPIYSANLKNETVTGDQTKQSVRLSYKSEALPLSSLLTPTQRLLSLSDCNYDDFIRAPAKKAESSISSSRLPSAQPVKQNKLFWEPITFIREQKQQRLEQGYSEVVDNENETRDNAFPRRHSYHK